VDLNAGPNGQAEKISHNLMQWRISDGTYQIDLIMPTRRRRSSERVEVAVLLLAAGSSERVHRAEVTIWLLVRRGEGCHLHTLLSPAPQDAILQQMRVCADHTR
jgi:hypothetical protein